MVADEGTNIELILQMGFLTSFFLHPVKVAVIIRDSAIKIFNGFINLLFIEAFFLCSELCSDC